MFEKKNGWEQPEEKFPETELEDHFAGFFSEEENKAFNENRKHRKKNNQQTTPELQQGPDILAVAVPLEDPGFVIEEVVSAESGESEEPGKTVEHEKVPDEHVTEALEHTAETVEHAEEKPEEETEKAEKAADPVLPEKKGKTLFPRANKIIRERRKHRYAATIGAVLIALALVGTVVLVSLLIRTVGRLLDNTKQKEAFEWKIYPLLMLDPATFDEPSQLDDVFLLKTALWSTLLEHRTTYGYDENGLLLVPASDLDVAAKKLYGDAVALQHQTFSEGYEFFYIFNEDTNTYQVPVSGQTAGYTPKVVKISKDGDIYTLIVGYVAPTTLWMMSEDGSSSESVPDKYLYYDLQKLSGKNYIVKSVRTIPLDELPDDLEVASQQSLNQTQYVDYDALYQEYREGLSEPAGEDIAEEPTEEPIQEEQTETPENQ